MSIETDTELKHQSAPTWNLRTVNELNKVLGTEKVDSILKHFWSDLSRRFMNENDPRSMLHDAHNIKSTAGFLGFEELERVACLLERACVEKQQYKTIMEALSYQRAEIGRLMQAP